MPSFPSLASSAAFLKANVFSSLVERAKHYPGDIFPLHIGDTWRSPYEGFQLAPEDVQNESRYAPPKGHPELLLAIEETLQLKNQGREVVVVSGATSGLSLVMQTLLNPGDEVLLPSPFWPLSRGIIKAAKGLPIEVPIFSEPRNTEALIAMLEEALSPKTVALYLNSPHNPTGQVLDPKTLEALGAFAKEHGLWLISDEVYDSLLYEGTSHHPLYRHPDYEDRVIAIHSMSKAYGIAGARIGWVHGKKPFMDALLGMHTHQVYCSARPLQLAAARCLLGAKDWLEETRQSYEKAAQMAAHALSLPMPKGGTFLFFDCQAYLRPGEEDALPFLMRLLQETGVLLTPGASSGKDFATWARLSYTSISLESLSLALEKLKTFLSKEAP